jgi:hypothetical protein
VELQPGTRVTINDFVTINGQVVFAKDEQVVIEGVSPNPERPEYKYVVTSTRMGSRFQLRDADVSPFVLSPTPVPPVSGPTRFPPPRSVSPQTDRPPTLPPPSGLPPKKDRKVLVLVLSIIGLLVVIGAVAGTIGVSKKNSTTPVKVEEKSVTNSPAQAPTPSSGDTCWSCHGSGEVPCEICHQTGIVPCESCKGTGIVACDSCHQTGIVTCDTCNGTGTVNGETCVICDGAGKYTCPICDGALKYTCPICDGKLQYACPICDGKLKYTCPICDGTGKVI